MLGGASSSESELANSGGGGMKGMAASLSSCFTGLLESTDWGTGEGSCLEIIGLWGLGSVEMASLGSVWRGLSEEAGIGVMVKELGLVSLGWMLTFRDSAELLLLLLLCLDKPDRCLSLFLAAIRRASGEVAASFPLDPS